MKKIITLLTVTSILIFSIEIDNIKTKTAKQIERINNSYNRITALHKQLKKRIENIEFYIKNNDCITKNYQIKYFNENIKKIEDEIKSLKDLNSSYSSNELSPQDMRNELAKLENDYNTNCSNIDEKIDNIVTEENK